VSIGRISIVCVSVIVHWRWTSNLAADDMSIDIHFRASVFLIRASFTSWFGLRIIVPRELLKKFSLVLVRQVCETAVVLRRMFYSKSLSFASLTK